MPTQNEIRASITSQLIAALENDVIAWRRPWRVSKNAGQPANIVSGRSYSGTNILLLNLHAHRHGFESRWYGTWNQWKARGGEVMRRPHHVPPGEWGAKVIFYKPVRKKVVDETTGEEDEDRFLVMREYTVFNIDQVLGSHLDNLRATADADEQAPAHPDFAPAEELIAATGAIIQHGGDEAFYARPEPFDDWPNHTSGDYIQLPHRSRFETSQDYFATNLHELSHWGEIRTNYDYRKHWYAYGELVAEMSSCFVAAELGIPQGDLVNHSRYLRHWLDSMRADSSYAIRASRQASKVTDYLMSFVRPKVEATEPELTEAA